MLLALVIVQIYFGALVAGLRAGLVYNTWPTMDGRLVPPFGELFAASPWWANPFANVTPQASHQGQAELFEEMMFPAR